MVLGIIPPVPHRGCFALLWWRWATSIWDELLMNRIHGTETLSLLNETLTCSESMAFDRPTERWIICQRQASMPRSMDWLNGALMSIWQGRGSYRRGTNERLWVEPTRQSICRAMKSRLISSPKTRIRQQHEKAHPQSVVTTGNNTSKWDGVFPSSRILAQRRLKVYVAIRLCLAIFASRVSCFVLCFFSFSLELLHRCWSTKRAATQRDGTNKLWRISSGWWGRIWRYK